MPLPDHSAASPCNEVGLGYILMKRAHLLTMVLIHKHAAQFKEKVNSFMKINKTDWEVHFAENSKG